MSDQSQTTNRETVVIIAEALMSVCSDGNSDALRVASDVLDALAAAHYRIVKDMQYDLD
jgi:hypothetical protein